MGVAFESNCFAPLERHRSRRLQAVPTITVLVGPQASPEWLWRHWHRPGETVVVSAARGAEVLEQWLGRDPARTRLQQALLDLVADRLGVLRGDLISTLAGRSPHQLETLAKQVAAQGDVGVAWVRRALALSTTDPLPSYDAPSFDTQSSDTQNFDMQSSDMLGSLGKLLGLVSDLPALIVRPVRAVEALLDVASTLYGISEEAPGADVALALDDEGLQLLRANAPPRVGSSLMEGLVVLRPRGSPGESRAMGARAIEFDPAQLARSQAELSLFEWLERRPRTRGLFKLNRVVNGDDPPCALEVDLLCESLALAVEVDGYHHFRDAEAFRRDRRKDVRLQELGYLVVRVLASDIDSAPEHVLETIDCAVERRRRRPS